MNKLIVHIGLSKTATSSLQQDYFNKYDEKYWKYIGVRQPRSDIQHPIYQNLMAWTLSKKVKSSSQKIIQKNIKNTLKDAAYPLLVSEEMLTVSSNGVSWQHKLERLEAILCGLDYLILVTVRKPVNALYSYYVERNNALKSTYPTFISFFKHSNEANVYRYDHLHKFLINLFEKHRISYVPFESIYDNSYISLINEAMKIECSVKNFKLPNRNKIKKTDAGSYAPSHKKNKWIGDVSKKKSLKNGIYDLLAQLKRSFLTTSERTLVPHLTENEIEFITKMLKESNRFFKDVSGIDYT